MGKRRNKRLSRKRRALAKHKTSIRVGGHAHAVTVHERFLPSLERYFFGRISASPIRWHWIGIALVASVLFASISGGYFGSSALHGSAPEVIRWAAESGDYELADILYRRSYADSSSSSVLGIAVSLEHVVYPEKKIRAEIERQEELLIHYPGSRDILIRLSRLYTEIGMEEIAVKYWERARLLDPNNPIFLQ